MLGGIKNYGLTTGQFLKVYVNDKCENNGIYLFLKKISWNSKSMLIIIS